MIITITNHVVIVQIVIQQKKLLLFLWAFSILVSFIPMFCMYACFANECTIQWVVWELALRFVTTYIFNLHLRWQKVGIDFLNNDFIKKQILAYYPRITPPFETKKGSICYQECIWPKYRKKPKKIVIQISLAWIFIT